MRRDQEGCELFRNELVARIPYQWLAKQIEIFQEDLDCARDAPRGRLEVADYLAELHEALLDQAYLYELIGRTSMISRADIQASSSSARDIDTYLATKVAESSLIALDVDGLVQYPAFQFDDLPAVAGSVSTINRELGARIDPEGALAFWLESRQELSELSPLQFFEIYPGEADALLSLL